MATNRDGALAEAAAPAEVRQPGLTGATDWNTANQRYLRAALDVVRAYLARPADAIEGEQAIGRAQHALQHAASELSAPAALDTLCADFGLSPFERGVLLMCAGSELDAGFGPLFVAANGDPQRPHPTFSLALAALPDPHWSALAPEAALRRWRLIEVGAGAGLVFGPLRIDERVLHHLVGVDYLDDRLLGIVDRVHETAVLTPSQEGLAERIAALWSQPAADAPLPAVQLCGAEMADKRGVAAAACRKLGWSLCVVNAQHLPTDPRELEALMRLWEREATLSRAVLLLDCDELDATDAVHAQAVARFVEGVGGLVILTGRERRALRQRPLVSLDVARPTAPEQRALWRQTLGAAAVSLNGHVETLVTQFNLNAAGIRSAAAALAGQTACRWISRARRPAVGCVPGPIAAAAG